MLDVLDDRFNDDVAVCEIGGFGRAFEPRQNLIFLLRGNAPLLRRPLSKLPQRLANCVKALVEEFLLDFEHSRVESSSRSHLRDSRAHEPTTENANFLDVHTLP